MKKVDVEGTRKLTTVYQPHEEKLYVQHSSKEFEQQLYEKNRRARQVEQTGKGAVRMHFQMSEQDYTELCLQYPLLHHGTTEQRRALWFRIARERPELVAMEFKRRIHSMGDKNARKTM